ncbi:hypothetical protein Tco_0830085 [Tanacetum coccineum]
MLGPNGGSGGMFKGGLRGNVGGCGRNGRRESSIAERGRGSLEKYSMDSKDGLGGGGFVDLGGRSSSESKRECLDGWVRAGGGEVKDGGVDFGVSRTLIDEIHSKIMRESGGKVFRVDGGAI